MIDLEKGILRMVRSGSDLTARQLAVLFSCREGPRTVKWLADNLNISKPGVSRAADKLGNLKYTDRKHDPNDHRSVLISLTKSGEKFLATLSNG